MKAQAIIPAAGLGERLKADVPKPLFIIHEKPILVHTLKVFEQCPLINSVILVMHQDYLNEAEKLMKKFQLKKVSKIVIGGKTRRESVSHGLDMLDVDTKIVVVHDAARPLLAVSVLERAIQACEQAEAVIVAVPVKPTIKKVEKIKQTVVSTLKREELWEAQTPQVFKKDVLLRAHQEKKCEDATDDAMLVESLGVPVKVIEGDYKNIKITTKEDVVIAEAFLKQASIDKASIPTPRP